MMGRHLPETAQKDLSKYFDDAISSHDNPCDSLEELQEFVTRKIALLLAHNPGRLMSILYRIDVAEHTVKDTFATAPPGELAGRLAHHVIKRQLQKAEIKERYRKRRASSG